jgi:hypothetical protein
MASALSAEKGTVVPLFNLTWRPIKDLKVGVKEAEKPHSVRMFDGLDLKDAPWQYRDGRVWVRIAELDVHSGQMLVIRYGPLPEDNRMQTMKKRAVRHLSSEDRQALSAGAWFVGFFPDWDLASKLVPLLSHPAWAVRRAAAESIGRLEYVSAGKKLMAASGEEKDPHVLADQLLSLARLGVPKTARLCEDVVRKNKRVIPRVAALRALTMLLSQEEKANASLSRYARAAAQRCSDHPDQRISVTADKLNEALRRVE